MMYNAKEQVFAATQEIAESKSCSNGRGHYEWSLTDMVFIFIPKGCQSLTGDVVHFSCSHLPRARTAEASIRATVKEINMYYA